MKKPKTKPSDFALQFPWDSVFQKSEHETIAENIMKILARTGNEFRELSFEEYRKERLIDGYFTEGEKLFFDEVQPYCLSATKAATFSRSWQ